MRLGAAFGVVALSLAALVSPASAQWSQVPAVPPFDVFSVWSKGDTILAGTDTSVFVSTNAGATWQGSARVAPGVNAVQSAIVRNGRLYAGTFGQGVFVSDNLGLTWQGFNQGLVGGIGDSQLFLSDLVVRGDSLYAGTFGAGVYVRNLAAPGTWSHYGEAFEPNQASNVEALALGGTRLLAPASANGSVFFRDPGAPEWTISWLNNVGLSPGLQATSAIWNGFGWVVGTQHGIFRSVLGQAPWTFGSLGIGTLLSSSFATQGRRVFGAFNVATGAVIGYSDTDGASWQLIEFQPGIFVYELAVNGTTLYAGRLDGLWRRTTPSVSVPGPVAPAGLRFVLAGPQPVGATARFRLELPEPGDVTLEVFDVTGRRVAPTWRQSRGVGTHEIAWDARGLAPGVYAARLTAAGRQAVIRFAHTR